MLLLTRGFCSSTSISSLAKIHTSLCHPKVIRLLHFVHNKNLPFSTGDVHKVCCSCRICAELKPSFYEREESHLIKASKPFERISINFKEPLPSSSRNKYLLVIIDEYSRFPFAFPCPNMYFSTAINCIEKRFSLCGMPLFVHSDNAPSYSSGSIKNFC